MKAGRSLIYIFTGNKEKSQLNTQTASTDITNGNILISMFAYNAFLISEFKQREAQISEQKACLIQNKSKNKNAFLISLIFSTTENSPSTQLFVMST